METFNKTMIANALCIEEDSRNIRFILNSLNIINAGQLQSAEMNEDNGQKVLAIVAENGTDYHIYLSNSGNVAAIKNLVTGGWPIQSTR